MRCSRVAGVALIVGILGVIDGTRPASAQHASAADLMAFDSVVALIATRSIHRNPATWDGVAAHYADARRSARSRTDLAEAVRGIFARLGDVHSALFIDGVGYAHHVGLDAASHAAVQPVLVAARALAGRPQARLLEGGLGWVLVPAMAPVDQMEINALADSLRAAICRLGQQATSGWIVDLRANYGGNVYPMLSGLGELLGDGRILSTVRTSEEPGLRWEIREGILHLDDFRSSTVTTGCPGVRGERPIAVLVGPVTASSGQAVAIAFAGDSTVRSFGEATARGYASSNQFHPVAEGIYLNLAEEWFVDRTGRVHRGTFDPDEAVSGEVDFARLEEDAQIRAAVAWIRRVAERSHTGTP